jgi:hypothetical protein
MKEIQVTSLRIEEIVNELEEIQERIMEASREAMALLIEAKGSNGAELDRRTWAAHIEMAVMNDTQWLGRSHHTLQDSIDELSNRNEEDSEDQS